MSMEIDIFAEALKDTQEPPPLEGLGQISKLAQKLKRLQADLDRKTEECGNLRTEIDAVLTKELPALMRQYKLKNFTLDTGEHIEVEPEIYGHINQKNRDAAFEWLRQNGFEDLIKTSFSLDFGKGQSEEAQNLARVLNENGLSFTSKEAVHDQTLKAWVREQVRKGQMPPTDLFGIFVGEKASVGKKKKGEKV